MIRKKRGVKVVTDKDKYVDETLRRQIQESFGATDEQLKARMDRIEKTLTDDEFAGAEERMMAKFMARLAAEEKEEEPEVVEEVEITSESDSEVIDEISATSVVEKKVVRFGRKKILLVAALAAAIAGALAVTGIGENSYFFREREKEIGVVFNSGKNIAEVSSFEDAYEEIKKIFNQKIFAFNYLPATTEFSSLYIDNHEAVIEARFNNNYIYFVQSKSNVEESYSMKPEHEKVNSVENMWLNMDIPYYKNSIGDNQYEYQTKIEAEGMVCWISGKMKEEEFKQILKKIYFY